VNEARAAFVEEARLQLAPGTDPAAPGGAVTTVLCGHWEHDGPCRWPHNNEIEVAAGVAVFRTLFVAANSDEQKVRERIDGALHGETGWTVLGTGPRPISRAEQRLAEELLTTPRRPA
jgi:hypothetical protein